MVTDRLTDTMGLKLILSVNVNLTVTMMVMETETVRINGPWGLIYTYRQRDRFRFFLTLCVNSYIGLHWIQFQTVQKRWPPSRHPSGQTLLWADTPSPGTHHPSRQTIPWADSSPAPLHAGIHTPAKCMLGHTPHAVNRSTDRCKKHYLPVTLFVGSNNCSLLFKHCANE